MGINTVDGVGWWDGGRVGFVGWGGGRECWVVGVVGWWLDGWLGSAIMPTYIYIYAIIVNPQCIYTMIINKTPPLLQPNPRSFHIVAESIGNSDVLLVNRNL